MTYRLDPQQPIGESVRIIAVAQIDELLAKYGKGAATPKTIHEARKAMKRLRALLGLLGKGVDPAETKRERNRLRGLARSLAGARDAHVMAETARSLKADGHTADAVIALLEKRQAEVAADMSGEGDGRLPVAALRDAQEGLGQLPLDGLGLDDVLRAFAGTYRAGRKLYPQVFATETHDEAFHDLRKQVQQHWRHLQLLSNAWPKALRPQIALAHELGEMLGRDHDLAVLAEFVRDNAVAIGPGEGLEAYLGVAAREQQRLRAHGLLLARRLYAEKPKALRRRMRAYWETAGQLRKEKAGSAGANHSAVSSAR